MPEQVEVNVPEQPLALFCMTCELLQIWVRSQLASGAVVQLALGWRHLERACRQCGQE